jgi:hypothetical protein
LVNLLFLAFCMLPTLVLLTAIPLLEYSVQMSFGLMFLVRAVNRLCMLIVVKSLIGVPLLSYPLLQCYSGSLVALHNYVFVVVIALLNLFACHCLMMLYQVYLLVVSPSAESNCCPKGKLRCLIMYCNPTACEVHYFLCFDVCHC